MSVKDREQPDQHRRDGNQEFPLKRHHGSESDDRQCYADLYKRKFSTGHPECAPDCHHCRKWEWY
jgi:hypothetical protein